jgi:hypothetical protein
MKELADKVYSVLEQHWRCTCIQRAARPGGTREARLSLARHRQLAPRTATRNGTNQAHLPAKFEVLLPVCKSTPEWKVTNVEVRNVM